MTPIKGMLNIATPWQSHWRAELIGTLVLLVDPPRVLLIEKLTGHGKGKINAPGGKWETGESLRECARRELREETGLAVESLRCRAELRFVEEDGPQWLGYVFVADRYTGTLTNTPEANPFWCLVDAIPYQDMWADDEIWLPAVLDRCLVSCETEENPLVYDFLFNGGELLKTEQSPATDFSLNIDLPWSGNV